MNCLCCRGIAKRRGFYRNKNFNVQRYECLKCGTSFSEKLPLDNLRVDFKQAVQVLNLLAEGCGIRAVSRLTGLHQQTVLNVLARAGSKAGRFLEANVKNVQPESVQADEMYCYVHCKERNNVPQNLFHGDQYLFLTLDSKSKLIISHIIGRRSEENAERLLADLKRRVAGRMQLSTDGWDAYKTAVPRAIGKDISFAQQVKIYASDVQNPKTRFVPHRYSPPRCIATRVRVRRGNPNPDLISTSYIERANLSVRLFNRRFTRLTLGYSKKFEYLTHSINLMVFCYNFVRPHSAVKVKGTDTQKAQERTPAMAAGLTDHPWTCEEMLKEATAVAD